MTLTKKRVAKFIDVLYDFSIDYDFMSQVYKENREEDDLGDHYYFVSCELGNIFSFALSSLIDTKGDFTCCNNVLSSFIESLDRDYYEMNNLANSNLDNELKSRLFAYDIVFALLKEFFD